VSNGTGDSGPDHDARLVAEIMALGIQEALGRVIRDLDAVLDATTPVGGQDPAATAPGNIQALLALLDEAQSRVMLAGARLRAMQSADLCDPEMLLSLLYNLRWVITEPAGGPVRVAPSADSETVEIPVNTAATDFGSRMRAALDRIEQMGIPDIRQRL